MESVALPVTPVDPSIDYAPGPGTLHYWRDGTVRLTAQVRILHAMKGFPFARQPIKADLPSRTVWDRKRSKLPATCHSTLLSERMSHD